MDKKFLHSFTKHLILAATKLSEEKSKEVKAPSLIKREIPFVRPLLKMNLSKVQLEPTMSLEQKLAKTTERPMIVGFGRINSFVIDPTVTIIECPGPNKRIKIKINGKVEETGIILTEDDISSIIDRFAETSNVPLTQIFKARNKNLTITAFLSPILGTKFLIIKD